MAKKLFLLDGMALVYRAHFAFISRPILTSKGVNTSALYGFTQTLLDILNRQQPTHIAVAFDTQVPTQRHVDFPAYKATRQEWPEDLSQVARAGEVVLTRIAAASMLQCFGESRTPPIVCGSFCDFEGFFPRCDLRRGADPNLSAFLDVGYSYRVCPPSKRKTCSPMLATPKVCALSMSAVC